MHDRKRDLLWQTRIITEVYFFVVLVIVLDSRRKDPKDYVDMSKMLDK